MNRSPMGSITLAIAWLSLTCSSDYGAKIFLPSLSAKINGEPWDNSLPILERHKEFNPLRNTYSSFQLDEVQ